MNLRAALWHARRDIRVQQVDDPVPKKGEVKIKIRWCGICGSDLHEYLAGPIFVPMTPHPLTGSKAPIILGHEFSGEVVEVGADVEKWRIGERVTADPKYYCGECFWCRNGNYNQCEKLAFIGLASGNGAFAEYICVPSQIVYKLPTNMTDEQGALVEPAAIAVHSIRRSGMKEGDTCAVLGAGPIGLLVLQGLIAAGASLVYVAEGLERRMDMARQLGAEAVLNPTETNVSSEIRKLMNGIGPDIVFECAGSDSSLRTAMELCRTGGTIAAVGIFEKPSSVNFNDVVLFERKIVGSTDGEFPATIPLISKGRMRVESLITSKIRLQNVVEEGFDELANRKERHIKILVSPD